MQADLLLASSFRQLMTLGVSVDLTEPQFSQQLSDSRGLVNLQRACSPRPRSSELITRGIAHPVPFAQPGQVTPGEVRCQDILGVG